MAKRSFDELSVVATGVQSLEDRFGKRRRHEYEDLPPISQWRSNLVGATKAVRILRVADRLDLDRPLAGTQRLLCR